MVYSRTLCVLFTTIFIHIAESRDSNLILVADQPYGFHVIDIDLGNYSTILLSWTDNVVAIDYDYGQNRVYFSDVNLDFIGSTRLDGSDARIDVNISESHIDGMAIDSDARYLFYTDEGNDVIVRLNLDNLIDNLTVVDAHTMNVSYPRAIVLDHKDRNIYWTDWGEETIEMASYDGLNRHIIISTELSFPNALAINFTVGLLYWGDAGTDLIEVSNLDGTNRSVALNISDTHIYGIALYHGGLLFTSWGTNSLYNADISSGMWSAVGSGFGSPCELVIVQLIERSLGQTCDFTSQCNVTNVECSKTCRCQSDFYQTPENTCEKRSLGQTCDTTSQCNVSNVECTGTCQCETDFYPTSDNTCEKRSLGQACNTTSQCNATNVECSGTCQCEADFYQTSDNTCEKRSLGQTCDTTSQCNGTNNECSGTCQCEEDFYQTLDDTCEKRSLGQTCNSTSQCNATNVECSGKCQCEEDFYQTLENTCEKRSLGQACNTTSQCNVSNVECSGTCQCDADFYQTLDDTCEKRSLGQTCDTIAQCNVTNVECSGTCQCEEDFYQTLDDTCEKRSLGQTCNATLQCNTTNVECSGTCQCETDFYQTSENTCEKRTLGQTCETTSQCNVTNVECSGTCQCEADFYQTTDNTCETRVLGQTCDTRSQCNATHVECLGTCQCEADFYQTTENTCEKRSLGQPCNTTSQCNVSNVECSGICQCQADFYQTLENMCEKRSLGQTCDTKSQCNITNVECSGTCQCVEDFYQTVDDTCEKRALGQTCNTTSQCNVTNVECSGTCECEADFYETLDDTCEKRSLGQTCNTTSQCEANNVECSGTCQCEADFFRTLDDTCEQRSLGQTCDTTSQCNATNVECLGTCQCEEDFYQTSANTCEKRSLGQTCNATPQCNATNVECSGTCQCETDFYQASSNTCEKRALGQSCDTTSQCNVTNVECSGTCECEADFYETSDNSCEKRSIGQTCDTTSQCEATNVECSGTCQCEEDFYQTSENTCEKRSVGQTCNATSQCNVTNGECSGTCQCEAGFYQTSTNTCEKRSLGQTCDTTSQCNVTNVECSSTCQCQSDFYQTSSNTCEKRDLGESCTDVSQCEDGNTTCQVTCQCQNGFYQFNDTINAADICIQNNLINLESACPRPESPSTPTTFCSDTNARCTELQDGAHTCQCTDGYFNSDGICVADNSIHLGDACPEIESSSSPTTNCSDVNARCTQTQEDLYVCQCKIGYFNNSGSCAADNSVYLRATCPVPESSGSPSTYCSDANAMCTQQSDGVNRCLCRSGYFDFGICVADNSIDLTDACAGPENTDSPSTYCSDNNAICMPHIDTRVYTCQCGSGYFDNNGVCVTESSLQLGEFCPSEETVGATSEYCSDINSMCLALSESVNVCQCVSGYYDDNSNLTLGGSCQLKVDLGDICVYDNACATYNSVCYDMVCKCTDGFIDSNTELTSGGECLAVCTDISIANGSTSSSYALYNNSVEATCDSGYTISGDAAIRCEDGIWSDAPTCEPVVCEQLDISNANINSSDTSFNTVVEITCHVGTIIRGVPITKCQESGEWTDIPTCDIECDVPEAPVNGAVNVSEDGTLAIFTCADGYNLVGNMSLTCLSDGEWNGVTPSCLSKAGLGSPCVLSQDCLSKFARCVNNTCDCVTVYDERTDSCDTMYLFPYGADANDTRLPLADDECSDPIDFTPGIPVFNNSHNKIYVCSNGLISFGREYKTPTPSRSESLLGNKDIIAPFFVDSDTSNRGNVFYRTYDVEHNYDELNTIDVRQIESVIIENSDIDIFNAQFVLFVTWERVTAFQKTFTSDKESTFQLILASDGEDTFVLFIYGHGLMKWETLSQSPDVWIGYSLSTTYQYTHPYAFSSHGLQMDANAYTKGISGLLLKRLTDDLPKQPNYGVKCLNWYRENLDRNTSIYQAVDALPQCPCDVLSLSFDPWWWWSQTFDGDIMCMEIWPTDTFSPYGKTCCYDLVTGLWINDIPRGGGLLHYHPSLYPRDHVTFDQNPRDWCCYKSNLCELYYNLHPIGDCYTATWFDLGLLWGDPHFRTSDRKNFTFNGLGEYILLRIRTEDTSFDLQARTERLEASDGGLSYATVFSAFAAIENNTGATFHVELNEAKDDLIIYGNGEDLTNQYKGRSNNFKHNLKKLHLSKRGDALIVLFPTSDISMNITLGIEMLTLNIIVPKKYQQLTSGLLGNYDGDPDNDFVAPNGTMFPGNMTERQIFHYAKLWEVETNETAFIYRNGTDHADYHDNNYVPKFLDEVENKELVENATRKCGNDPSNIACIFDFIFAGEIVSSNTLTEGKRQEETTFQVEQTTPSLDGCQGRIFVNQGESVACPIRVSNESGLYFTFLNVNETNGVNVAVNSTTKTLVVEIDKDAPVDIRVIATNPGNNKTSKALTLDVLFCSLCNGHGQCINEPREDSRSTDYFRYAKCQCEPQYQGSDCEEVFDGCLSEPCSIGQTCTSLNVSQQISLSISHICGPCPDGFETIDGKCTDIDECNETNLCDQECQNTEGSYECTCNSGYRIDTNNPHNCKDINECNEAIHECEHLCINEDGTFSCSCFKGYTLDNTTDSCAPTNVTICAEANINCTGTDGCTVGDNLDPYCFCANGFEVDEAETGLTCLDIDECDRNVCPQGCVNTVGSYICTCFPGYELTDPTSCEECKFPFWGNNCENVCNCSDSGTDQCHKARGCVCKRGWKGHTCEDDVNECQDNLDDCNDARDECINTAGSYRCGCRTGFLRYIDESCKDVDECSSPLLHLCDQMCVNAMGSYTCSCREGYILTDQTQCTDINECETGNNNCEQICVNTDGSYQCFCHFGYKLRDDRQSCRKIEDPCSEISNLTCSHYCVIHGMKAECRCTHGYELESDKHSCTDVDECTTGTHICTQGAQCHNTDGSYQCTCSVGNKLENDNRTCSPCDDYHYGQNCLQSCSCVHGQCYPEKGCICDPGWLGEDCDIDKNECRTDEDVCRGSDTVCVNTPGSYVCSCRLGYTNDSGACKDFDECTDAVSPVCDQECVNTDGSYYCACKHGFIYQSDRCTDIDECILGSGCDHSCDNTIGSYRCSCMPGFYLNLSDRHSCITIGQCNANDSAACEVLNATCVQQTEDETVCICAKGFTNDYDGGPCYDKDECANSTVCSQKCSNFDGGFRCECFDGYYLLNDDRTCRECDFGTFGQDCDAQCTCNMANTVTCDAVTGQCTCKPGWENENCSSNIDECDTNTDICPEHSTCEDTPGSFVCICDTGYVHTADDTCTKCNFGQFGVSCSESCQCNLGNTISCNNVDGTCTCALGWNGTFCGGNVNECLHNQDICSEKPHSECSDTNGSYNCVCPKEYSEINGICIDIDECRLNLDGCIQKCVNTNGSFICKCSNGYHGTWNNCSVCVETTYGENCTHACPCNFNNTLSCDKVTGKCNCKIGWNGTTCNDDVNECSDVMMCQGLQNGGCHNTAGSFICDCVRGYTKNGDVCVLDSPKPVPANPNTERVELSITLEVEIPSDTDLSVKSTFNALADKIKKSLLQLFKEYTDLNITIVIIDIRRGSIIADYEVIYDNSVTIFRDVITDVTLDLINGKSVEYDGENVTAKTDSFGKQSDPCHIFEAIYGQCTSGTECVVQNSGPFCRSVDNYNRNIGIIIGTCLGGLTVAIIVLCLCLLRARQQQRRKDKRALPERQNVSELLYPPPDYSVDGTIYSEETSTARRQVWPTEDGRSVPGLTWKSMMWNFVSNCQNHGDVSNEYRKPYTIPRAAISDVRPKILGGNELDPF